MLLKKKNPGCMSILFVFSKLSDRTTRHVGSWFPARVRSEPPALEVWILNHRTVRKSQVNNFKRFIYARSLPVLQLLCSILLFMWQTRTGLLIVIKSTILCKSL